MSSKYWLCPLLAGLLAVTAPPVATAQAPINGFNATIALPSSVDKFYSDVNTLLVKTGDGIESIAHERNARAEHGVAPPFDSLRRGMSVTVHYTVKGIQASADEIQRLDSDHLSVNEGTVTSVDPRKKRIAVAFANGTTETLRLARSTTEHSAEHSRVIVYHSDQSGRRVGHYFKPATHTSHRH